MKTKYLVRFLNRAAQFDADLELTDVFSSAVIAGQLTAGERLFEFVDAKSMFALQGVKLTPITENLPSTILKPLYERHS